MPVDYTAVRIVPGTDQARSSGRAEASLVQLLLTLRQAAQALAVSERTLWGLTAPRGPIRCVKIGRSIRYAVSELQRWIADQQGVQA
jgi:predicted DNA-binding transcriptional regulator AlpA